MHVHGFLVRQGRPAIGELGAPDSWPRQAPAWLLLSDMSSGIAGGVAAALMLATSGLLASTGRAELGRGALAGVERAFRAQRGTRPCVRRSIGGRERQVLSDPVRCFFPTGRLLLPRSPRLCAA
jgi:hypothetical protein